jgi:hypothetical protein
MGGALMKKSLEDLYLKLISGKNVKISNINPEHLKNYEITNSKKTIEDYYLLVSKGDLIDFKEIPPEFFENYEFAKLIFEKNDLLTLGKEQIVKLNLDAAKGNIKLLVMEKGDAKLLSKFIADRSDIELICRDVEITNEMSGILEVDRIEVRNIEKEIILFPDLEICNFIFLFRKCFPIFPKLKKVNTMKVGKFYRGFPALEWVDGKIIVDEKNQKDAWVNHFNELGKHHLAEKVVET